MNSGGHQLFRIEVKRGQSQVTFGKSEQLVRLNSNGKKHKKDNTDKIYHKYWKDERNIRSRVSIRLNYKLKACNFFSNIQLSRKPIYQQSVKKADFSSFFFGEICSSYSILPSFSSDVCIIFGYLIRPVNLAW